MKKSLIYFLRKLQDPWILSELLDMKDASDEDLVDRIEEEYGIEENITKILKHFKNIPKDIQINIMLMSQDIDEEEDVTQSFPVHQQLLIPSCDGDIYLVSLGENWGI